MKKNDTIIINQAVSIRFLKELEWECLESKKDTASVLGNATVFGLNTWLFSDDRLWLDENHYLLVDVSTTKQAKATSFFKDPELFNLLKESIADVSCEFVIVEKKDSRYDIIEPFGEGGLKKTYTNEFLGKGLLNDDDVLNIWLYKNLLELRILDLPANDESVIQSVRTF